MILIYMSAVILANFTTLWFGPNFTIVNAFFLIGLNLVVRDILHYRLSSLKMMGLILLTGIASYLINPATGSIAVASLVAFLLSTMVDWQVFSHSRGSWFDRSNKSNLAGGLVDSLVFPTIAFGGLMPWIVAGQFAAKFGGGLVWSYLLRNKMQEVCK